LEGESMKLRHAAGLALVGWYLMMPPYAPNHVLRDPPFVWTPPGPFSDPEGSPAGPWDLKAPLSQWRIAGSYDTAAECAAALSVQHKKADKAFKEAEDTLARNPPKDREVRESVISWIRAMDAVSACIATDDPRLKQGEAR